VSRDWVQTFVDYTEGTPSPRVFRWWSGLSCVSAALERKCYTFISDLNVYPNLFIMLTGPPAAGKGVAAEAAREILRRINSIRLSPEDLSEAALYDSLEAAHVATVLPDKPPLVHHSMTAILGEFGTLFRIGDISLCGAVCGLYDCKDIFEKGRRTQNSDNVIHNAWLNMLSCVTPSYLGQIFTPTVLSQGLPSRFVLVYGEKPQERPPLFRDPADMEAWNARRVRLRETLLKELKHIHELRGEFYFDTETAQSFVSWYKEGMQPRPEEPKLDYYADRRLLHLVKMMMCLSASRRNTMIIEMEDFETARDVLLDTEKLMPRALDYAGGNILYSEMVRTVQFVSYEYFKYGKAVAEWKLRKRLERDTPLHMIEPLLTQLCNNGELRYEGKSPERIFLPRAVRGGGGRVEVESGGLTKS